MFVSVFDGFLCTLHAAPQQIPPLLPPSSHTVHDRLQGSSNLLPLLELGSLRELDLAGNPCSFDEYEDEYHSTIVDALPLLETLDGYPVNASRSPSSSSSSSSSSSHLPTGGGPHYGLSRGATDIWVAPDDDGDAGEKVSGHENMANDFVCPSRSSSSSSPPLGGASGGTLSCDDVSGRPRTAIFDAYEAPGGAEGESEDTQNTPKGHDVYHRHDSSSPSPAAPEGVGTGKEAASPGKCDVFVKPNDPRLSWIRSQGNEGTRSMTSSGTKGKHLTRPATAIGLAGTRPATSWGQSALERHRSNGKSNNNNKDDYITMERSNNAAVVTSSASPAALPVDVPSVELAGRSLLMVEYLVRQSLEGVKPGPWTFTLPPSITRNSVGGRDFESQKLPPRPSTAVGGGGALPPPLSSHARPSSSSSGSGATSNFASRLRSVAAFGGAHSSGGGIGDSQRGGGGGGGAALPPRPMTSSGSSKLNSSTIGLGRDDAELHPELLLSAGASPLEMIRTLVKAINMLKQGREDDALLIASLRRDLQLSGPRELAAAGAAGTAGAAGAGASTSRNDGTHHARQPSEPNQETAGSGGALPADTARKLLSDMVLLKQRVKELEMENKNMYWLAEENKRLKKECSVKQST